MRTLSLSILAVAAAAAPQLSAQFSQPIPLSHNFNGIVHAGEAGSPDNPNGFRSISDRALDFSAGVPTDALLSGYQVVGAPAVFDIVHVGNRNTVDGGSKAFDAAPDGDDIGIQPNWLPNPDQTTAQITDLSTTPIPVVTTANARFLLQVSNGGGSVDVTFRFASGSSFTAPIQAGDWFGGTYAGTAFVDSAFTDNNLSIDEASIDLRAYIGEVITAVEFGNPSNANAGYAILAGRVDYDAVNLPVNRIALNHNFNGIVHAGESGNPDAPDGFRSISDRALDFSAGVPSDNLLDRYAVVGTAGALDIVHLGNRNSVNSGGQPFDPSPDGNNIGIQPNWLPNPDQTGPQQTTLTTPIRLEAGSQASLLCQISNGGGSFDVRFGFTDNSTVTATVVGPDWFGGTYPGAQDIDAGVPGANLNISERRIDLTAQAGKLLNSIEFLNAGNFNAGYAILAMNVTGCGAPGSVSNLGGGNGATISSTSTGVLGTPIDVTVAGAPANAAGFLLLSVQASSLQLSSILPTCTGTWIATPSIANLPGNTNAGGGYSFGLAGPTDLSLCGTTLYWQHIAVNAAGPCLVSLSDALALTLGY